MHVKILEFGYLLVPPFQDKESVGNLVKLIDKSNGYIFAGIDASAVEFSKIAVGTVDWDYYRYPWIVAYCIRRIMLLCHTLILLLLGSPLE